MVAREAQLSELKIRSEEAQLSHIGAQYSSKETQIFSYDAKATCFSKIMEYRQRLFIHNARRQIIAQYHRNSTFIST